MKILLIDGHALFCEGLRHILQSLPDCGADDVLEAGNFPDGLELAGRHPDLDLVLLELKSPGCEEAVSVQLLRQRYPHIKILVVSSEEDCRVIREVLIHGASGYVCKSSTGAALLNALNLVLAGSIYVPPQLLQQASMAAKNANNYSGKRHSTIEEYGLTARQMQILAYLAMGFRNKEIAGEINISVGTVKVHVAAVYQALGVKKRVEAAQIASQFGLAGAGRISMLG